MDHLGLVETVDGLGESVVIGISDTADRRFDAGFSQTFSVFDRDVLGGFKRSSQHRLLFIHGSHSSRASAGVFHPSAFLGRALRAAATAVIWSALWTLRSVPFGKY
jgi:hypothetical protein